jgi:adenine-specific DNA-methyltransferase
MSKKQKLELTWVGKEDCPRLEPRILIEDPSLSHHASTRHDGDIFENILIQGDNLLALKALENDFADKVNCIYISIHLIIREMPLNTMTMVSSIRSG